MQCECNPEEPMPEPQEGTVMLEPALCWASMGMPILPLQPWDKPGWSVILGTGYEVASAGITDPQRAKEVWDAYPMTNMGLVCGTVRYASHCIMVLDLDVHEDGADPVGELVRWQQHTGIKLPPGPTVETPRGIQLYFLIPEGTGPIWSGAKWLPNVDVRADGSYVVAPPSVIATRRYPGRYPADKFPEGWAQYRFLDMSGTPYYPRPSEFFDDLENAVAPAALLEDINSNRNRRGKEAAYKAATGHTRAPRSGRVPVAYYIENGIPKGVVQWDELWAIAWSVHHRQTPQETFDLIKHIADKSPQNEWDPWIDGYLDIGTTGKTLWSIVNRCYDRADRHRGDEIDQRRRAEFHAQRDKETAEKYAAALTWLDNLNTNRKDK
ncbi:Bifunctional DNA primase/polymerase, N-terminal [Geodermatophilus amargosae]|uniref:Bifunctional DNA primase/polymerase, N-terminal n=2 Tax=Geodermatophilus amargosae TaxID=1296565 RepID=A0A1I7CE71_9ACTN|nr:Bifunctional DNA primase/polymerase, N-terminal [Geodermatophilus amargosae]